MASISDDNDTEKSYRIPIIYCDDTDSDGSVGRGDASVENVAPTGNTGNSFDRRGRINNRRPSRNREPQELESANNDGQRYESGDRRAMSVGKVRGDSRGRGNGRGRGDRKGRGDGKGRGRGDGRDRGDGRGRGDGRRRGDARGRGDGRGRGHSRHNTSENNECALEGENAIPTRNKEGQTGEAENGRGVTKKRETEPMRFHKLVHLSRQLDDPDNVLLDIAATRSGFKEFLEKPIEAKCYGLLMKVISTIVKSQQLHSVREVMQLVEQYILPKLPELLNDVCLKTEDTRYIWSKRELEPFVTMITDVLNKSLATLPSSLSKCSVVILSLQQVQMHFFPGDVSSPMAQAIEETKSIKQAKEEEMRKIREERVVGSKRPSNKRFDENRPPPEDFHSLSILPTLVDLQIDEKPFLRANKTKGKYDSIDTYLDIQYRLLREDYINPLRSGISQYRESVRNQSKITKFRDIRLYHDVQILRPICSASGINHVIQFDASRFTRMNWAASKRLIYGSLLCLSNDDFESIIYAVVTERKEKDLNEGMLQVHFEELPEWMQPSDKFIMAETTAYFEAYRHILEGLQEIKSLPFERYIVHCETAVKPPEYLLNMGGPSYDFSCLVTKEGFGIFPVLNTHQWPSKSVLGFDSSQYDALKIAITKEMAIIQGPPGTGKTYVGLKIAKLLRANKHIWQRDKNSHSILVVCYTNHALDQFLEGVLEFSLGDIVRIGGRCNSDALEEYVLSNLKKKKREERTRSWGILQNERDCRAMLRESEQLITGVSMKLKKCTTEIISLKKLAPFMTEKQESDFLKKCKNDKEKKTCLYEWLGLTVFDDEDESTFLSEDIQVRRLWEIYIIEKADNMTQSMANFGSVWELELHSRAQLYKSWISEFIDSVESKLGAIKAVGDTAAITAAEEVLDKLVMYTETNILSAKTLSSYIRSPVFHRQLQQLTDLPVQIPTDSVLQYWLCLDESKSSTDLIKATLDSIQEKEVSGNDLEEERELQDDDLMFTYGDDEDTKVGGKQATDDSEDWTLNWKKKKTKQEVKAMLKKTTSLTEEQVCAIQHLDVWRLPLRTKRDLYHYWLDRYRNKLREIVKDHEKKFNDATLRLEEVRNLETIEILKSADFIGMTTTGAAKFRKLLQNIAPRIIIVEEAAEVLESHIVTTLHDECKHLILIGDHKQLRPSTTVYELAKKYNLDISLFERLVNNGVPCVTLSEQHRMRPSISVLMRHENLYPNLRDHPIVHKYDNVKGLDVNVQFITHEEPEGTNAESTSYHNRFEARFLARFCSHLLKQGYLPDQITVLTPYMGQVLTLRKEMPKAEFEGVRITAVDNYQGEENEIILLSLVRSSASSNLGKRNPIGFLGIENRVCVALSRAKMGLFVFGNFSLLRNHSEMWDYMIRCVGKVRSTIKCICQNHPQNVHTVCKPEDFDEMPEGGCKESCGYSLPCGHICEKFCHILDKEHKHTKCFKPCPKKCEFGHRCTRRCFEDCKNCETKVEKLIPMCGHVATMSCHEDPLTWKCKVTCTYTLSCGHACEQKCEECTSATHTTKCKEECEQALPCGHTVKVECYLSNTIIDCTVLCEEVLECGHKCVGKCGTCLGGKVHSGCKGSCSKLLPCGHKCSFPCSELCPPCSRKCEQKCPHNIKCKNKCAEPCIQCNENCKFQCTHKTCDKPCSEKCDDVSCNEHCTWGIQNKDTHENCSHKCISLCGEICPKLCATCDRDKLEDADYSYTENDRFIELPDCGHIIEINRMDVIMSNPIPSRGEIVKRCPKCKKVIRTYIRRYATTMKENRQAVLERTNRLTGSAKERFAKAKSLKKDIIGLKNVGIGLDEEDAKVLNGQVDHGEFGSLLVTMRKLEKLNALLKLRKDLANFAQFSNLKENLQHGVYAIRDAKRIHSVLMVKKQYASKQYWREIGMEILRIQTLFDMMKLLEEKHGKDDPFVRTCFQKSIRILTDGRPFNDTKATIIEKVKARIKNLTATSNESSNKSIDEVQSDGTFVRQAFTDSTEKHDEIQTSRSSFEETRDFTDKFDEHKYTSSSSNKSHRTLTTDSLSSSKANLSGIRQDFTDSTEKHDEIQTYRSSIGGTRGFTNKFDEHEYTPSSPYKSHRTLTTDSVSSSKANLTGIRQDFTDSTEKHDEVQTYRSSIGGTRGFTNKFDEREYTPSSSYKSHRTLTTDSVSSSKANLTGIRQDFTDSTEKHDEIQTCRSSIVGTRGFTNKFDEHEYTPSSSYKSHRTLTTDSVSSSKANLTGIRQDFTDSTEKHDDIQTSSSSFGGTRDFTDKCDEHKYTPISSNRSHRTLTTDSVSSSKATVPYLTGIENRKENIAVTMKQRRPMIHDDNASRNALLDLKEQGLSKAGCRSKPSEHLASEKSAICVSKKIPEEGVQQSNLSNRMKSFFSKTRSTDKPSSLPAKEPTTATIVDKLPRSTIDQFMTLQLDQMATRAEKPIVSDAVDPSQLRTKHRLYAVEKPALEKETRVVAEYVKPEISEHSVLSDTLSYSQMPIPKSWRSLAQSRDVEPSMQREPVRSAMSMICVSEKIPEGAVHQSNLSNRIKSFVSKTRSTDKISSLPAKQPTTDAIAGKLLRSTTDQLKALQLDQMATRAEKPIVSDTVDPSRARTKHRLYAVEKPALEKETRVVAEDVKPKISEHSVLIDTLSVPQRSIPKSRRSLAQSRDGEPTMRRESAISAMRRTVEDENDPYI